MAECTFAQLRDILLGLGLQVKSVKAGFIFEHGPASTRLYLDPFTESEPVDAATLVIVRRFLDEKGILPRARFEELLRERSLAG